VVRSCPSPERGRHPDPDRGDTALILRPKIKEAKVREVFRFLSSAQGQEALSGLTRGSVVPALTISALSDLWVPILPAELSRELAESEKDEDRVRRFADSLLSEREALFRSLPPRRGGGDPQAHRGTFMGAEPTNKELSWTGITIDRISEGRIVESWANWDMMGMMQQLGVVHAPAQSEEASPT
jgi:SnoaL-like polyketide cyclase